MFYVNVVTCLWTLLSKVVYCHPNLYSCSSKCQLFITKFDIFYIQNISTLKSRMNEIWMELLLIIDSIWEHCTYVMLEFYTKGRQIMLGSHLVLVTQVGLQ